MNMIAYTIHRNDQIPPLSWLFRLSADGAQLICGQGVESSGIGFFEGAWAGPFEGHDIHECPNVFGSGGRYTADGWTLVSPSHTLDAIYILHIPEVGWCASNSLAFLISATDARPQFHSSTTLFDFIQIVNGFSDSPRCISTGHRRLYILHYHNAILTSHLQIRPKPPHEPFRQYQDYCEYLRNVLAATAENAAHNDRRIHYQPLATVSSGYDSPACATLARSAGCSEGVTFLQSRDGEGDDGLPIGETLGLRMIGIQHPLFSGTRAMDGMRAAEFFATGMQGEDLSYAALSGFLRERLLITGFHGDKIWDRHSKPSVNLQRGDVSGSSLGEFRLRENFIHLPLPFVGARQHASVHAISNSPEMVPYMVGGSYDRPIPRRIAEEAGVPRTLFGQRKKAVSILVNSNRRLMPDVMRHAVEAGIRKQPVSARIRYRIRSAWYAAGMWATEKDIGGHSPARLCDRAIKLMWPQPFRVLEHLDPFSGYAMEWALAEVGRRYRSLCTENSSSAMRDKHLKER